MIERYSRKEMADIWSDKSRFSIWLEIETLACEARAELGDIPKEAARIIREKGNFEIEKIQKIEAEVHHDVIAFLTNLAEYVGEPSRFVHQGLTSSDILDTTFSVQLVRATDMIIEDCKSLLQSIAERANEHKMTLCIGRSHGIHAEPTTFGLKLLTAYAEFQRLLTRLQSARDEIATGALSGAVGTFANVPPEVEEFVCRKLGLIAEPISTQVIPRDRHAVLFSTFALVASSIERIATEIRHLQRSEVAEVSEYFAPKQKGSSAMPHKRNPILTENLTGIARMIRGYSIPAMENVALWHERDISHSAVERVIGPDATILLDFALHRMNNVIKNLIVYPDKMLINLDRGGGVVHSQGVMLALAGAGLSREDAYAIVQKCALNALDGGSEFKDAIYNNEVVKNHLTEQQLDGLFSFDRHLKHVNDIFDRVINHNC